MSACFWADMGWIRYGGRAGADAPSARICSVRTKEKRAGKSFMAILLDENLSVRYSIN